MFQMEAYSTGQNPLGKDRAGLWPCPVKTENNDMFFDFVQYCNNTAQKEIILNLSEWSLVVKL